MTEHAFERSRLDGTAHGSESRAATRDDAALDRERNSVSSRDFSLVALACVLNAVLWTAGHQLTSGPILGYFAYDAGFRDFALSLVLVVPETVGGLIALTTRHPIVRLGGRRNVWLLFALLSRGAAIVIPLLVLWQLAATSRTELPRLSREALQWGIIAAVGLSSGLNAISHIAFLSWTADLVTVPRWNRLYAVRTSAILAMSVVGLWVGFHRDRWVRSTQFESVSQLYAVLFLVGSGLILLSLLPMLWIRPRERSAEDALVSGLGANGVEGGPVVSHWALFCAGARVAWSDGELRRLLLASWTLALFSGFTQVVVLRYRIEVLHIGLLFYTLLEGTMRGLQIPATWLSSWLLEKVDCRAVYVGGIVLTAIATSMYLFASADRWWMVWPVFLLYAGWAPINLAGPTWTLRRIEDQHRETALALFQQVSGVLAGVSGLLGGLALQHGRGLFPEGTLLFAGLIAISAAGRAASALFLVPSRRVAGS